MSVLDRVSSTDNTSVGWMHALSVSLKFLCPLPGYVMRVLAVRGRGRGERTETNVDLYIYMAPFG